MYHSLKHPFAFDRDVITYNKTETIKPTFKQEKGRSSLPLHRHHRTEIKQSGKQTYLYMQASTAHQKYLKCFLFRGAEYFTSIN